MPDIAGWRPAREAHAIQMAYVAVNFAQPAGDILWRKVDGEVAAHAATLGLTERQPVGMALPIPLQRLGIQGTQVEYGAAYLRRERPDFYSEQVQVTRDQLRYESWDYIRWAPFKDRARTLLKGPAETYSGVSSLGEISAQYVDSFTVAADATDAEPSAVINVESEAIAKLAYRAKNAWHSHCGSFDYPDAFTRRLSLINIDVLPALSAEGMVRTVQITTQVSDQFGQAGSSQLEDGSVDWAFIEGRLQTLHLQLKELLRVVLTDKAAAAIALS